LEDSKMVSSIKDSQKERMLVTENAIHPGSLSPHIQEGVPY
jgi:hypothetical protein